MLRLCPTPGRGAGGGRDAPPSNAVTPEAITPMPPYPFDSPSRDHNDNDRRGQQPPDQPHRLPPILLPSAGRESGRTSLRSVCTEMQSEDGTAQGRRRKRMLPNISEKNASRQRMVSLSRRWVVSHRKEQQAAPSVVDIARELFYDVTVRCHSIIVEDGHEQMQLLAVKAALSAFLLEEIVKTLPRYAILAPCVGLLLRTLYVPDTQEMRDTLGGTLAYPLDLKNLSVDSATRELFARYARKTYFIAHYELTQKVILHAHANRARMKHFRRLPRIFALLNANWIKSILRTVLKAWRHMCRVRRQGEQKHRARWARRLASERIRSTVGVWRVYANVRLQCAAAEEKVRDRIDTLKANTRKLENEIEVYTQETVALSAELGEKEKHLVLLEKRIAEREQEYQTKLEEVREIDRVGSRLLDSLLLKTPFPPDAGTLSPLEVLVLWANTTLLGSIFGSLLIGSTDEDFARHIDELNSKPKEEQQQWVGINAKDVSEEDLPFNRLLGETATVCVPMHHFLALIYAMDDATCPIKEELKKVCLDDVRVRSLRSQMENQELPASSDPETAAVLEAEAAVGRTLVEAYEALTGNICIVKAEQLMTRKRGIQLVFLAGLMRYFVNWMESNVKRQRTIHNSNLRLSVVASSSLSRPRPDGLEATVKGSDEETPATDSHLGARDRRYAEWYHPPRSHIGWTAKLENQQRWIALSFSALHEALRTAVETQTIVSTEVQEDTPEFMDNVTLKRLSDILPKEAITSSEFFLRLARCVESFLPKMRLLFLLYAQQESTNPPSDGGGSSRFITFLDFWRLLRDCRVVCGPGRLDRSAVRRIFAKVVEGNTNSGGLADRSFEGKSGATTATKRSLKLPMSADVDLKSAHYKTRLSAAEFVEMLLRCAHMWDGVRYQRQKEKRGEGETAGVNRATETTLTSPTSVTDIGGRTDVKPQSGGEKMIQYDVYDTTWALRPTTVREFFRECIVARGLRGPTLDPFRRAMHHPNVRHRLATHFDVLFSLFSKYARPKEAYGTHVTTFDSDSSMRRLVLEQSTDSSPTTSPVDGNRATRKAQYGNVGIVRVLTLSGVQGMAREFEWCRIRRVTMHTVKTLFAAAVADAEREPDAVFFPEWLDLLCAMALYHNPDPLRPLHEKLGPFLDEHVLGYHKEKF